MFYALSISTAESHTANSFDVFNKCGLAISITAILCCFVITPLSTAVGVVSACLIVRRKKTEQTKRPLPETPRPPDEVLGMNDLVYDYVSNENIGTQSNRAYDHTFQKNMLEN